MSNPANKVIVRIPPSPTGLLHIGTARTVLFNYLFAKQNNGKVILRSEDTDKERSKPEYEDDIKQGLAWLGFTFDEFHRQSERTANYKRALERLITEDKAYISKEEAKEEGQRSEVIRFRNPGGKITFTDMIRGDITFDVTELGDFVIAKSLEEPLYHLAVVVDDIEMEITHIIRGEDHISNTPRQILIMEALGGTRPLYAHLPLIFDAQKAKLSKRKHGEIVAIKYYREHGYLPEAIINFLALLGWNPGTEQEIFSIDELIKIFDISKSQKGGAVFNPEKLKSINRHYVRLTPVAEIEEKIKELRPNVDVEIIKQIAPLVLERIDTLSEIQTMLDAGEFEFFWQVPTYAEVESQIVWKKDQPTDSIKHLQIVKEIVEKGGNKDEIMTYAESVGRGSVLWPMRYALSGRDKSPDPFTIFAIIGRHESISRIDSAIRAIPTSTN